MTRAFIDSCVFVAAVRSPTGGSGEVLRYASTDLFEAVISDDVVEEVIAAGTFTAAKDKAIVAGAHIGVVDYLVTLDKKHLLNKSAQIEINVNFKIIRPEDLLKVLRRRN